MTRTPDEIKKGMLHCSPVSCRSNDCPYKDDTPKYEGDMPVCRMKLWHDMVCLIQQLEADKKRTMENAEILSAAVRRLEAERDAAVAALKSNCVCTECKWYDDGLLEGHCNDCHYKNSSFEWRGVQKEDTDV